MNLLHFGGVRFDKSITLALTGLGIASGALVFSPHAFSAETPAPVTYSTATVNGDPSEWGAPPPGAIPMYDGGDPGKTHISNGYLRYSCSTQTLFVLVLGLGDPPLLKSNSDAWATLGGAPTKLYTGASGNDGTAPDFQWIEDPDDQVLNDVTYDLVKGYEASFSLAPGTYADLVIHGEYLKADGSGGTTANVGFRDVFGTTSLTIECKEADPVLKVDKFYDSNANGMFDSGESLINGWQFLLGSDLYTTPQTLNLATGTYTVMEQVPVETNWVSTTPQSLEVQLGDGEERSVSFGNACLGAGGGLTPGFWSSRNGATLYGSDDQSLLVSKNLRSANGSDFDPSSYKAFRNWLLNATATNMAYMLSAHLAAMELNVLNGKVSATAIVSASGTTSANALGFATISDLLTEANLELGAHGSTPSGSPDRAYQEALKNALDAANNNQSFVQPSPCPFSFSP